MSSNFHKVLKGKNLTENQEKNIKGCLKKNQVANEICVNLSTRLDVYILIKGEEKKQKEYTQ